ncbi:hypothetical protein GCM10007905_37880 [Mixta theicola]|nr:hypothetical protein GCM10007905_37880 [Mixta theicola]
MRDEKFVGTVHSVALPVLADEPQGQNAEGYYATDPPFSSFVTQIQKTRLGDISLTAYKAG